MARQLTTKAQVNGYRFLLSRLEHALVRRDARMLHDPMRSQLRALALGTVMAVLLLAGFGVWGLIRPQGSVGDASILLSKNSGGLYVLVDGTLHPALNLASARLISGSDRSPKSVADSKLAGYPRGPLLGIPGAPAALPGSAHPGLSTWSVCDEHGGASGAAGRLSVLADPPVTGDRIARATGTDAVLVSAGDATFLVYQVRRGEQVTPVRAEVDTGDIAVMRAFGLEGAVPRPVNVGLLNTLPEVDPLRMPRIDGGGNSAAVSVPGVRVGSVVKTFGVTGRLTYYAVLADAVQPIGEATAEMLRLADPTSSAEVMVLTPASISSVARTAVLPVTEFPQRPPHLVSGSVAPVLCTVWSRTSGDPHARTELLLGRVLPLPDGARTVALAGGDGPGPRVDAVYVRPGSGEYVRVTGDEPDSARAESRFYLSDSGIRFGVPDPATGQILGLGESPAPVPWSAATLLAAGPTLSRHAALVAHDTIAANAAGVSIPDPGAAQPR